MMLGYRLLLRLKLNRMLLLWHLLYIWHKLIAHGLIRWKLSWRASVWLLLLWMRMWHIHSVWHILWVLLLERPLWRMVMLLVLLLKWRLPWRCRSLPLSRKSSRGSIMIVHSRSSSIRWLKHLAISLPSLLRRRRGRASTPRVSISSLIVIVIHMSRGARRSRWSISVIGIVSESSPTTSASSPRTEISSSSWWSSASSSIVVPHIIRRSSRSLHISSRRRPSRYISLLLPIAWPIVIAIVIIPDWWRPRWGFRIRSTTTRGFVFLHL